MRIFALETDLRKLEQRFLSNGEQHIITVFYHWFVFFIAVLKYGAITAAIIALASLLTTTTTVPWEWTVITALILWLLLVPYQLLKRYIDWKFDFIFVTTTRVIIIDQSSIFHQSIKQVNLENFASVSSHTMFWNIFPFGKIVFELKEGHGRGMTFRYIPDSPAVSDAISDSVALFVREGGQPAPGHHHIVHPTPPLTTAKDMAITQKAEGQVQ